MSNFLLSVYFLNAKFSISTMASAFEWLTPFQCLRRLSLRCLTSLRATPFNAFGVYRFAVSMPSAFIASPFQCLRRLSLRRFNAFGVYRFAVSMPSAFIASLFQCLRRLSLRRFNAFGVSMFNFVEGYGVSMCFARLNGFAVSMPSAFEWHYQSPVPLGTMLR